MGKIKVVELTNKQRTELEKGYRNGKSHTFRSRCQMILLKSEKRTSMEVADVMGCCEIGKPNTNGSDRVITAHLPSSNRRSKPSSTIMD